MNHPYVELDQHHAQTDCQRCGYTYVFNVKCFVPTRRSKSAWYLCKSCKAKPMKVVNYGTDFCVPWQGDFDLDLMVCLDSAGRPYKPGPRTCGHADCVRKAHLVWV